eukprot:TRINITY_DN9005_c0_g1_i1.p1 TRINITY_DN9005_c0_g1~~TRINITY_DN9005_c0_g1_i1.p1  ORF type:complete len:904 (-),score=184.14 TRINITY_DN9005_c0_g1_i1:391-3102(-)
MIRARVPKQIKLEVLYKQGVYFLLALNYLAFCFALAFDFFEYDLRIKAETQSLTVALPNPRANNSSFLVSLVHADSNAATITNLTFLNRFLWVHLDVRPPVNLTSRLVISFDAQAFGRNSDTDSWIEDPDEGDDSHNITCTPHDCTSADLFWTTALRFAQYQILFSNFETYVKPLNGPVHTSDGTDLRPESSSFSVQTNAIEELLAARRDDASTQRTMPQQPRETSTPLHAADSYIPEPFEPDDAVLVSVGNETVTLGASNFVVQFTYHSGDVSWYEMGVNVIGLSFSLGFLAYYLTQIAILQRWSEALPEQRWITFLLIAVFLYQNPMFVPSLYFISNQPAVVASKSFIVVATTFFLVFLLLVVDGLSYNYSNYSWPFYTRKVAFGVIWLGSYWTIVFFIFRATPSSLSLGLKYFIVLLVAGVVAVLCGVCWPVWYLITLYRTGKKLNALPFLSTRYRQLAFRFILLQSTLVVVYLIGKLVVTLFFVHELEPIFTSFSSITVETSIYEFLIKTSYASISTFVLLSVCMYSIAFAYLPPWSSLRLCTKGNLKWASHAEYDYCILEKDAPASGETFCLETATWLLEFSWDAYFDPQGISTPSSFGPLNLEKSDMMGFSFYHYLYERKDDIFVAFFVREPDTLVVAFRGTSSMRNVSTDLRFRTVPIPHWVQGPHLPEIGFLEPKAHSGFWNAYKKIWRDLINVITKFNAQRSCPVKVFCTGHSLGGALATIAAFEINTCLDVEVHMYNFGCPRVGNHSFANLYNRQVPRSFRLVNDCDMVTSIPDSKLLWDFKHVGKEIVIDRYGNLITDLTYVERRFRALKSSLTDHKLDSYRQSVMECFKQSGCETLSMVRTLSNLPRNAPMREDESATAIALGIDPDDANADSPRLPPRRLSEHTPLISPV